MASGTINNNGWKYFNSFSGGNPLTQSLPTEYNELMLEFSANGVCMNFNVLKAQLSSTSKLFSDGYYNTTSDYCIMVLSLTNATVTRATAIFHGTSYTPTVTVYYR